MRVVSFIQPPLTARIQSGNTPPPGGGEPAPEPPKNPEEEQKDRIIGFVQRLEAGAAMQLRYLSSAAVGQIAATTAGVLAFAPLANQLGQIHVLTVGAVAAGIAGGVAGYMFEKHRDVDGGSGVMDHALGGLSTLKSLPSFLYPTIQGANPEQLSLIHSALDKLPMGDVTSASTMTVMEGMGGMGISGVAPPALSQNVVYLNSSSLSRWFGEELVTHELAHSKDLSAGYGPIGTRSMRGGGFGFGNKISRYAGTNFIEDYAESYVAYHQEPTRLKSVAPSKYAALDAQHPRGVEEWLTDRPGVRRAGKDAAQTIGKVPYLRNALELASSLVGPFQIHRGASQLTHGDPNRGMWNLTTGFLMLGGAPFPVVAAAAVAGAAGQRAGADKALAASLGTPGVVGLAVREELGRRGFDLEKKVANSELEENHSLTLASTLGGAAVGMLGGAALYSGSLSGSLWASSLGAVAGGLLGGMGSTAYSAWSNTPDEGGLRKEDKVLLGKMVAGAVVAGAAGAYGGGKLGGWLGGAVGQSIAGSVGGATGAAIGRAVGSLAGGYALAKVGARL